MICWYVFARTIQGLYAAQGRALGSDADGDAQVEKGDAPALGTAM